MEIEKLHRIERFGLEPITGRRVFLHGEYRRLIAAESIVIAYESRKRSVNWTEWKQSNPKLADLLFEAEKEDATRNE